MLKKYDLTKNEHQALFEQMMHPDVYPYIRLRPVTWEDYLSNAALMLNDEAAGKMITRVIFDEWNRPIGMIYLYNIEGKKGYLGTWLGKQAHGKGYNKVVKELFLQELFEVYGIEQVFMRIKCENIRSQRAVLKLGYCLEANELYAEEYQKINEGLVNYHLYVVEKDVYLQGQSYVRQNSEEVVSIA